MALTNLTPVTRKESILNGDDTSPVTRSEYFLQKAVNKVPTPEGAEDAGKVPTVNSAGNGFTLETPAGGGITVSCTFAVRYDETAQDVVIECDKSYSELSAILAAAEAPVYSEVNYMGVRLYSVVYPTSSGVDQYIGSAIHLLTAREHQTQGRVVATFDAFVGRLSDNTPIILRTPTA